MIFSEFKMHGETIKLNSYPFTCFENMGERRFQTLCCSLKSGESKLILKEEVFSNIMPFQLANNYQCFRGA